MSILTRDDVRQKLRVMLYQEQLAVARIAKDCGMDGKTIMLASNGEMTNRTLQRFTRWFELKAQGVLIPRLVENKTVLPTGSPKIQVVRQISRMFGELQRETGKLGLARHKLELLTAEELQVMFFRVEIQLKYHLLNKYSALVDKYHIWLYDKWDYWQWKEKVEVTLRDTNK